MNGLKDHQIQGLVNEITANLKQVKIFQKYQCLRELIHTPLLAYLEKNNLRIDSEAWESRNNSAFLD